MRVKFWSGEALGLASPSLPGSSPLRRLGSILSLITAKITGNFWNFPPLRSVRFPVDLRCNPGCIAHDSLFFTGTGNFIRRADSPIPLGAFGNRIPLALFLPNQVTGGRSI
jgi:hypothetical protein